MPTSRDMLIFLICAGAAGCGLDDSVEGCGSEAAALAAQGLDPSAGAHFRIAGAAMPLPNNYLYRVHDNRLELFVEPGVYCDSGDWGLIGAGSVHLQVHNGNAPADPFEHFPALHRGYMREQINLGIGPFDYSFDHNMMNWRVHAYFANTQKPRVIFMYLRAELPHADNQSELAIHYFPSRSDNVLGQLTAAVDAASRERARSDQ